MEEAPDLPGFDLGIETNEKPDTPEGRLDHWKRKLLDLTKRNRLLNLKPSKTAIPLICPDPAALQDKPTDGEKISVKPPGKPSEERGGGGRALEPFQTRRGGAALKQLSAPVAAKQHSILEREPRENAAGTRPRYHSA